MTSITRYKRAVERITRETSWLSIDQKALVALGPVVSHGMDFFQVARNWVYSARLLRMVMIFEQGEKVASFWYLYRCNPKGVTAALENAGLSIEDLRDFSNCLKTIRDKTFVHIDKAAVSDPQQVYNKAGITKSKLDKVIWALWDTMKGLYQMTFCNTYKRDAYTGHDIPLLKKYRDDIAQYK